MVIAIFMHSLKVDSVLSVHSCVIICTKSLWTRCLMKVGISPT